MIARRLAPAVRTCLCLGALVLAAAPALSQGATPPPAPDSGSSAAGHCGVCHPRERAEFAGSSHAQESVRCVSCHGGDDQTLEVTIAHGGRFVGRPARAAIPGLCAGCHSDQRRMRPYNLPVDQYALYGTSAHGRRLAAGDGRAAVCSDCHAPHATLPASDPRSEVHPLNIPRTCGRCHGDSSTVAGASAKEDVYRQYASSVHARQLVDGGNLRAPTCASCHGAHGAAPPEYGDADKVCGGKCHTVERRFFAAGPHRAGLVRARLPECVSCHGHHAIGEAQPDRLGASCSKCHAAGSRQLALGARLWAEYSEATRQVESAAALTAKADAIPLNTDDYRARLEEARTYLSEALPAAHSVQEEVVSGYTTRARSVSREVESEIREKLGHLRVRKILLVVFWFYILLTIVVLRRFRRAETGA